MRKGAPRARYANSGLLMMWPRVILGVAGNGASKHRYQHPKEPIMPKPADFPFSDDQSTAEAVYLTEIERKFLETLRKIPCDHWTPDFFEITSAAHAGIIMASGIKHGSGVMEILHAMLPSMRDGLGLDPEETTMEDVIAKLFADDPIPFTVVDVAVPHPRVEPGMN